MAPPPHAVLLALELVRQPALAGAIRRQPLPRSGTLDLIRIAGGCTNTCGRAADATRKGSAVIKQAAILYLQQALFVPGADSYRILGASPDTPQETLREHMRWLMRWLHPDRNRSDWEAVFAGRVLRAWDDVKSLERRARYDRSRGPTPSAHPIRSGSSAMRALARPAFAVSWVTTVPDAKPPARPWRRLVLLAVALLLTLAAWLAAWPQLPTLWPAAAAEVSRSFERAEPLP